MRVIHAEDFSFIHPGHKLRMEMPIVSGREKVVYYGGC